MGQLREERDDGEAGRRKVWLGELLAGFCFFLLQR